MNYHYVFEIRTNNLCYGGILLKECASLSEARQQIGILQNKYGCCDIYKKRKYE